MFRTEHTSTVKQQAPSSSKDAMLNIIRECVTGHPRPTQHGDYLELTSRQYHYE